MSKKVPKYTQFTGIQYTWEKLKITRQQVNTERRKKPEEKKKRTVEFRSVQLRGKTKRNG